jgi:hypothetical protein
MFDPKAHLIQLPRKHKDKATGQWTTVVDDYLEVKWRIAWFRDKYPHGTITTAAVLLEWEKGIAIYQATVEDGEGGRATGTGTETRQGFADFVEKAETRAMGRALAALGIGTQFVGEELSEGDHIADAPVAQGAGQAGNPLTAGIPQGGNGTGRLPVAERLTPDQARELKRLAQTAFGYAEGEAKLRHDLGFEPDERTTLRHLCAHVSAERYAALVAEYTAHLQAAVEADVP